MKRKSRMANHILALLEDCLGKAGFKITRACAWGSDVLGCDGNVIVVNNHGIDDPVPVVTNGAITISVDGKGRLELCQDGSPVDFIKDLSVDTLIKTITRLLPEEAKP